MEAEQRKGKNLGPRVNKLPSRGALPNLGLLLLRDNRLPPIELGFPATCSQRRSHDCAVISLSKPQEWMVSAHSRTTKNSSLECAVHLNTPQLRRAPVPHAPGTTGCARCCIQDVFTPPTSQHTHFPSAAPVWPGALPGPQLRLEKRGSTTQWMRTWAVLLI